MLSLSGCNPDIEVENGRRTKAIPIALLQRHERPHDNWQGISQMQSTFVKIVGIRKASKNASWFRFRRCQWLFYAQIYVPHGLPWLIHWHDLTSWHSWEYLKVIKKHASNDRLKKYRQNRHTITIEGCIECCGFPRAMNETFIWMEFDRACPRLSITTTIKSLLFKGDIRK